MKISEMITDRYKLRIPPTVYYDLLTDVREVEEEQEPVLDKIRAEIETKYGQCKLTEYIVQYDGICTRVNEIGDISDILQIIDKYKAESERDNA